MPTHKQYQNKIKKQPTINQTIKKGIATTTIKNIQTANTTTIQKARIELLTPLIKDQEIRKIMTTTENFQKLKNRLDYKITAQNQNNNTLLTTELYGHTIEHTIKKLKEDLQNKKTDYINLKNKGYQNTNTTTTNQNETIKTINIQINLRKG